MHGWIVIIVGVVLAVAGITEGQDGIVAWVFEFVEKQPLSDVWRPVYNPEPMDTHAYRPLSVLILKLAAPLMEMGAMFWTAIHALGLAIYGWVAWVFLRQHGFNKTVSSGAAIGAMAMPSILFSAWICVEFDVWGSVAVMGAAICLVKAWNAPSRLRWGAFVLLAFVSMTIKETSALQLFAYLVAFAVFHRNERRCWWVVGLYLTALLLVTAPMHWTEGGSRSAYHWTSDEFEPARIVAMLFHVGSQILFLVSAAGVLLLVLGAFRRMGLSARTRGIASLVFLGILFFVAPVARYYSHFESVVFSHWWWSAFLVLAWFWAWGMLIRRDASTDGTRTLSGMVLLTVLGFATAPLVLPFARPDVSARIFATCVPVLFAFMGREAIALWTENIRSTRIGASVLGGLLVLFVGFSAFNAVSVYRARMAVPHEVKNTMAQSIETVCPAIVTVNPVQLVTAAGLRTRGADRLDPDVGVEQRYLRDVSGLNRDAVLQRLNIETGREVLLYVESPRAVMDAGARSHLRGDFGWTYDWMPDGDDGLFDDYQDMVYGDEIPIEAAFRRSDGARVDATLAYVQFPVAWHEIPRRLWQGIPLVESYEYAARLYYRPGDSAQIVSEPCRRRDSGKHRGRTAPESVR